MQNSKTKIEIDQKYWKSFVFEMEVPETWQSPVPDVSRESRKGSQGEGQILKRKCSKLFAALIIKTCWDVESLFNVKRATFCNFCNLCA